MKRLLTVLATTVLVGLGTVFLSAAPSQAAQPCPTGIAHKGNAYYGAPTENSLNAFTTAFSSGATWVETDVHFTSDNVPVIMHDATVDATTNGTGPIASMTAAQFTALTLDNDTQHPPTLDQLLAVIFASPDRNLLLEVKDVGVTTAQEQILVERLQGHEAQIDLYAFANRFATVQHVKDVLPLLDISILGYDPVQPPPAGIVSEDLEYTYLTQARVDQLHSQGLKVKAWTVNATGSWDTLRAMGVDAIITNKVADYLAWCGTPVPDPTPTPVPPTTTEYVANPGAEVDLTGWTGLWTATSKTTRVAGGHDGSWAFRNINGATTAAQNGFTSKPETLDGTTTATTAGKVYTGSVWVKPDTVGQKLNLYVRERNAAGTTVSSKTATITTVAGWQKLTNAYTAQGIGNRISVTVWATSSAAGKGFTADSLSFVG